MLMTLEPSANGKDLATTITAMPQIFAKAGVNGKVSTKSKTNRKILSIFQKIRSNTF